MLVVPIPSKSRAPHSRCLLPQGLKPLPFGALMYGLKPVPFTLKPVPFTLKPVPFTLKPVPFTLKPVSFVAEARVLRRFRFDCPGLSIALDSSAAVNQTTIR
jgi:hypothetical protein